MQKIKKKTKPKSPPAPVKMEVEDEPQAEGTEEASHDTDDDDEMDLANFKVSSNSSSSVPTKKRKKGIIYISNIPKHMNVTRLREILGDFGKIGRVYLQPEKLSSELETITIKLYICTNRFFHRRKGQEKQEEALQHPLHRGLGGVRVEKGGQADRSPAE